jgi:hypothetical protein
LRLSTFIAGTIHRLIFIGLVIGIGCTGAQASTLIVTTTSEAVNGDTSSPITLKAAPGPDGISLPEAMQAVNQVEGPHHIGFDATLNGASIVLNGGLPSISVRGLTIDGDIDADGDPDIIINGSGSSSDTGFQIRTSEITIIGIDFQGYQRHGIHISTDSGSGITEVSNIEIRNCRVTSGWDAIAIHMWQQEDCVIRDVVIRDNELLYSQTGVSITPATGVANRNQILDVTIVDNTIRNSTSGIAVSAMGAVEPGNKNNLIQNLNIIGNTISGHNDVSVLISGGNASACQFNQIDKVLISNNVIDGTPVTMELVGAVGGSSTDNVVSNVSIVHNQLTGGGVQLATGYDNSTSNNRVEDIIIGWNTISGCAANGVMAVAGSTGASWNTIQRVDIVNNLITDCSSGAGILLHGNDGVSPNNLISDIDIVNNTIAGNGNSWAGGININSKHSSNQITGVDISSTILWSNSGSDAIRGSIAPNSVINSLLGDSRYVGSDGNSYSNPEFVAPATPDYRLQSISPAIDTGDPAAAGAGDYDLAMAERLWDGDGNSVARVDIGAYEYGAAPVAVDNHTLMVTKNGTGSGTVASRPEGIDCGADCSGDYLQGTLVSLIATPADGSIFAGWSGGGCSGLGTCHVFMDAAKTPNAEFNINSFTVGGNVSNLTGSGLVLQINGGDELPIGADGGFTFDTPLEDGSGYSVTVQTQPTSPNQTCDVTNGNGTLSGDNVTNVEVNCVTETYTIGGNVNGLAGSGLVLWNNGGDDLAVGADGGFTFDTPLEDGSGYSVIVQTQPTDPNQTCSVTNGSGTLSGDNVTNVEVNCVTETYTIGGNVNGLAGSGLVLQNNSGDDLAIGEDGDFTFPTPLADSSGYSITVLTQPSAPDQACRISNGSGTLAGSNVSNVAVACITQTEILISDGFE